MVQTYITLAFVLFACTMQGQHLVEGQLMDQQNNPLTGATTLLLEASDSTMISFALTNDKGKFRLEDVREGSYILQISYVGYSNINQTIQVNSDREKTIDLGVLQMEESSKILTEVTIKAEHIPMGIRGDTISYNADAFKVRPGASVEDLLKKLPGVEVDRNGAIKAQGEDVEKVLVDGKEFFGNDPLIATKNLEAEAVDKVEVFDKKSEIAEFTGIDDGQESKTINLQLKEDHKAGGFGKVKVEGGTEDTWAGKFNYNRFNPAMQASVILAGNNINEQAFSFNEYISFMGGLGSAIQSGGFSGFNFGGPFRGDQEQEGITRNISLGTNFNFDFSKKIQLFSNYFYIDKEEFLDRQLTGQNFSNAKNFESRDTTLSTKKDRVHRLNTKILYKPSPFTEFVFRNNLQGILLDNEVDSKTNYLEVQKIVSRNGSMTNQNQDQFGLESNVQWRQKFEKKGRNWINNLTYKQANTKEVNDILNEFYFLQERDVIFQYQTYNNLQRELNFSSNYTEPIGKKNYVGFSYKVTLDNDAPMKDFFDETNTGQELNRDLSTVYKKSYKIHNAGISLKRNTKKAKFNAGLQLQQTNLSGTINDGQQQIDKPFTHLLPGGSFEYDFTGSNSMSVRYSTNVTPPSLSQLMPLPDNRDPNVFIIGNPDLIPEYAHQINVNFNLYDQFNFTSFFMQLSANTTSHKITNRVTVLEDFTRKLQPINTDGYQSVRMHSSFSTPIRPLHITTRIGADLTYSTYDGFLGDQLNKVSETSANFNASIGNRKKEKVDISIGARVNLNSRKYAINEDFNQQFINYDWFIESDFFITKSLTLTASFDQRKYSSEFFSDQRTINLLNAAISKSFNEERITFSLKANDLLKQNIGFRRYGTTNSLQQSEYNTLSRYIMLGISYKLTKRSAPEGIMLH